MKSLRPLALIAVTLVVTGCGGSSNTSSTDSHGHAASRVQLVAEADAICQRMSAEFAADKPANSSIPEIVRFAPARAVREQKVVAELSQLTPPATIAGGLQKIIAYRRTLALELADLARVAKAKDAAAIRALAKSKAAMHRELIAAATAAGLTSCALTG